MYNCYDLPFYVFCVQVVVAVEPLEGRMADVDGLVGGRVCRR